MIGGRPSHHQHAFAGNPLIPGKRDAQDLSEAESGGGLRILPLLDGKPLVASIPSSPGPVWRLAWQSFGTCHTAILSSHLALDAFLADQSSDYILDHHRLVYLGDRDGLTYCALDVSFAASHTAAQDSKWSQHLSNAWIAPTLDAKVAFLDLRLLMTGTNWADKSSMGELSIAGQARALLDWHSQSRFCGGCGSLMVPKEAGKRRQCPKDFCKRKLYPRIDPVVIMLVIDKERDSVILGRQSRFVPRMWSCLAGFIEPGESLEEAVRREIWEEVGIEIGQIVYHNSQPWPVGPSSMSCQLMVGFFAFATTFDIRVDTKELEEAQWHTREEVRKALTFNEYKNQLKISASKIQQTCSGEGRKKGASAHRIEIGEVAPMFVPGPYAIAHHLISSWALNGPGAILSKV